MNRIAWLGQAAVCYCLGFLPDIQVHGLRWMKNRDNANEVALKHLNIWLKRNGMQEVDMEVALSVGRQIELY